MNKQLHILTAACIACLSFSTLQSQTIIYIKPNGSGNGSSWANARGDLRTAIASAGFGTQIWVAVGTYSPTDCTTCTAADRRFSFEIPDGVALYGGFSGTETAVAQRNLKATPSVLSGDIDRDGLPTSNSFNIIYTRNVSILTILDGFTIQNGNANDNLPIGERSTSGGAWYNDARVSGFGSMTIRNCIFKNNYAIGYGGAVMNHAGFNGLCLATFQNCEFTDNASGQEGGAVNNLAYFGGTCNPTFAFCNFTQNHSAAAGGAVFSNAISGMSEATFRSCRFVRNIADTYGGGIYNLGKQGNCTPTIANCLFWGNQAFSAAGVYCLGSEGGNSSPKITNCIFYKNTAHTGGSVYANANDETGHAEPKITNCIIWQNSAEVAPVLRNVYGKPTVSYSILNATDCTAAYDGSNGGATTCGDGMIFNQNPLFVNADGGDFRLLPQSPAINMGLNAAVETQNLTTDLDSLPRVIGGRVDIGAIEFNNAAQYPPQLVASPVSQTVCASDAVVLKARFSGSPPFFFQWYKNDVALPNETSDSIRFISISRSDSGSYRCIVRNEINRTAATDAAALTVRPTLPLSIRIVADHAPTCEADTAVLRATWTNGGATPKFNWQLNGVSLGLPDSTTIYKVAVNSIFFRFTCQIRSSEQCAVPNPLISNELQFNNLLARDSASIALARTPSGDACPSDTLTFSTTTRNAGATPQYQWLVNGAAVANSQNFLKTAALRDGDSVRVVLTSSQSCLVKNQVMSNAVAVRFRPRTPVSVALSANRIELCKSDTATFTATPTGGGATPQYQWLLNNNLLGETSNSLKINTLKNLDRVRVRLVSSETCPTVRAVESDSLVIKVIERVVPTVEIAASKAAICRGEHIEFSINQSAGLGATPQYDWLKNAAVVAFNVTNFATDSLRVGDTVRLLATSSATCATVARAISNAVSPTVNVCTAVGEVLEKAILIYPNPSDGASFTVVGLEKLGRNEATIAVYSAAGALVLFKKIMPTASETRVELNETERLPTGVYIVKIGSGEAVVYRKWFVAR